jgi:glycosyltransferase involved in cell wall biosynthesis
LEGSQDNDEYIHHNTGLMTGSSSWEIQANQMRTDARPRVSVILPTYNRASLLKHALDSVLSQTVGDIETIVIDDGSTDKTVELVKGYTPRVRYIRIEHSGLPSVARNVGLRLAQGDYIAFLDSDDQWLPAKVERQLEVLETRPAVGLVCSNALALGHGRHALGRLYLRDDQAGSGWVLERLLMDNFVITSTAMVRRSLLSRTGLFSEDPLLLVGEDYDLWLRIAAIAQIHYLPEALVLYRDDPAASIRAQQSRVCYWQGLLLILDRVKGRLAEGKRPDLVPAGVLDQRIFACRRGLRDAYLAAGRFSDAVRWSILLLAGKPVRSMKLLCGRAAIDLKMRGRALLRGAHGRLLRTGGAITAWRNAEAVQGGLKLNLGCGEHHLPGYTNIDFPPEYHTVQRALRPDVCADIRELTYPSGSVEEIRMHHVFEHFDRGTAVRLLIEWYEWLKVGGRLVIETPDFERCAQAFVSGCKEADRSKVLRHIFGSHEAPWAAHFDGWYRAKLELFLGSLGYRGLVFSASDWRGTHNITVTARKLEPLTTRDAQVQAGEELLRLSLVDNSDSEERMIRLWMDRIRYPSAGRDSQ